MNYDNMDGENINPEEISRMFASDKEISDEQLALLMHRFNLDWDTIEIMPAFEEHRKQLFNREIEK
jgi:hypothetical protein